MHRGNCSEKDKICVKNSRDESESGDGTGCKDNVPDTHVACRFQVHTANSRSVVNGWLAYSLYASVDTRNVPIFLN
jgi:hypothetical protein